MCIRDRYACLSTSKNKSAVIPIYENHITYFSSISPIQLFNEISSLGRRFLTSNYFRLLIIIHNLSLYREGRWGTTDDFATSYLHFSLFSTVPEACPFPDAVYPPLLLSALPSSPFNYALQDGFGQT